MRKGILSMEDDSVVVDTPAVIEDEAGRVAEAPAADGASVTVDATPGAAGGEVTVAIAPEGEAAPAGDLPVVDTTAGEVGAAVVDTPAEAIGTADDIAAIIEDSNVIQETEANIADAEAAQGELAQYADIVAQPEVSEDALEVVSIAVEALRTRVGFKKPKLATENFTSKKLALESIIRESNSNVTKALGNARKFLTAKKASFKGTK